MFGLAMLFGIQTRISGDQQAFYAQKKFFFK